MEKYKKLDKLGQGAFGKVYLVENLETGKKHVMKEIELSKKNPKAKRNALAEVGFLQKLNHPNIVQVMEVIIPLWALLLVYVVCVERPHTRGGGCG